MNKATLSPTEARQALGVGRNVFYRLVRENRIPHLRLGRKIRVPVAALDELLRHPGQQKGGQSCPNV